jgi:hypothetical protein
MKSVEMERQASLSSVRRFQFLPLSSRDDFKPQLERSSPSHYPSSNETSTPL